jgi:hypothetical protein
MNAYHLDGLERADANLAAFFSKQLEQIRPELYEVKFPELKGRLMVPVNNNVHPGASSVTTRSISEVGEADWVEDLADDAPEVEVTGGSEDNIKMKTIQGAYGWHLQEARSAAFAGIDLSPRKARACRQAIERKIDQSLLVGATIGSTVLQGLFSLTGSQAVLSYAPTVLTFEDEDSDAIYGALMDFVNNIYVASKEIEVPDTMVLPTTTKMLLKSRRMGDANNMSVLDYFLASNEFIKTVHTSHYLEQGASGSTLGHGGSPSVKRIVAYRKDPDILEGWVNEFEQLPPEFKSARVLTTCLARSGGVQAHRPKAISYYDGC